MQRLTVRKTLRCPKRPCAKFRITAENLLPEWHTFYLHPKILFALHAKQFLSPTPIQKSALPFAFAGRDVIGIAQTVSKDLAALCLVLMVEYCTGIRKDASIRFADFTPFTFPAATVLVQKTSSSRFGPGTYSRIGTPSVLPSEFCPSYVR